MGKLMVNGCLFTTALLFVCCNSNTPQPELKLSKEESVVAWPGYADTVMVVSPSGYFRIRSDDSSIAEGRMKDDSIFVSTSDFGRTELTLSDHNGNETKLGVVVEGFRTDRFWNFTYAVGVDADSEELEAAIREEVEKDYELLSHGAQFRFGPDNKVTVQVFSRELTGIYSQECGELKIGVRHSDPDILFEPGNMKISFPVKDPGRVEMNINLTEKYRIEYPGREIERVSIYLLARDTQF